MPYKNFQKNLFRSEDVHKHLLGKLKWLFPQEGNAYSESNSGASRTYGANNNDMAITATGNINKSPGPGSDPRLWTKVPTMMLSMPLI